MTPTPIPSEVSVDDLAQEIRRIDGNNEMGAGNLAEAIMSFLSRRSLDTADGVEHPDDVAVDRFAVAMKAKLKWERDERGRGGWQQMSADDLSRLLVEHLPKADPVDVANFCMMLHQNGQSIASRTPNTEVVVKGLEWEEDEPGWWCAQPAAMIGGFGYEVRVTDSGKVRARRGRDDWTAFDGTLAEAKAAAQADFDQRIRSALAEPERGEAEPDFYAVQGSGGYHIGLWPDKETAEQVLADPDYVGAKLIPLYASPPSPAQVTDQMVERALEEATTALTAAERRDRNAAFNANSPRQDSEVRHLRTSALARLTELQSLRAAAKVRAIHPAPSASREVTP